MGVGTTVFSMKFVHIEGKKNVVADVISRLRMYGLYQNNNSEEDQPSLEDAVKNIIEEIHNLNSALANTAYVKIDKLNLDLLWREQQWDRICKKKVKEIKMKPDPDFILDENSFPWKAVKLRYSVDPTIVVPRKLTNLIIVEFHTGKGHQGINHTVNMMWRYYW